MRSRGALKKYAPLWELLLRAADASAVVFSGLLAGIIYLGGMPEWPGYPLSLTLALLLCLVVFPSFGVYRPWRGASVGEEIRTLTLAWTTTLGILTFFAFITKTGPVFSRVWFLTWLSGGWLLLVVSRLCLRAALRALRHRGYNLRRVLLVGPPTKTAQLSARLAEVPWMGLSVAGSHALPATAGDSELDRLAEHVADCRAEQVWIAVPLRDEELIHRVQFALRYSTVDIRYVPDISSFKLLNQSITEVAGMPVISLSSSGMDVTERLLKAIEDRILATAIVITLAPLMVSIAIGVKLSSPGPVFFRQRRAGIGGETIEVIKFRSMVVHAEPAGQVTQAKRDDIRVTPFGAFLRRTSLDELPQFFNVLRGDMSIVGPRPHTLEHNEQYKTLVDQYMARHKIKPGITGWAQINGYRGETDTLEKMQGRIQYDLYYMENWSLSFDLKIIMLTIVREIFNSRAY